MLNKDLETKGYSTYGDRVMTSPDQLFPNSRSDGFSCNSIVDERKYLELI